MLKLTLVGKIKQHNKYSMVAYTELKLNRLNYTNYLLNKQNDIKQAKNCSNVYFSILRM